MWRSLHVTLIATLWILLWLVVTIIETAPLLHDTRIPLWLALSAVLIPIVFATGWAEWELRSEQFDRPALNPSWPWFRHHFRRLPFFLVLILVATYLTNRVLFHSFLPLHVLIPWAFLKAGILYSLWLALVFSTLTASKIREDSERLL